MSCYRLESINGKLKQVIDYHSSLEEFIHNFFVILTSLRSERDHKAAIQFQKVKVHPFSASSPEAQYAKLLTSYAFSFVLKQIKLSDQVKSLQEDSSNTFQVKTSEGMTTLTVIECRCVFQRSMKLPCRHIFALRRHLGLSLFDASCCSNRWTTSYYRLIIRWGVSY